MCNVITSLINARRFEYKDPDFMRMMDLLEDSLKEDSGLVPQMQGSGQSGQEADLHKGMMGTGHLGEVINIRQQSWRGSPGQESTEETLYFLSTLGATDAPRFP